MLRRDRLWQELIGIVGWQDILRRVCLLNEDFGAWRVRVSSHVIIGQRALNLAPLYAAERARITRPQAIATG
jgi:hypothetical protein